MHTPTFCCLAQWFADSFVNIWILIALPWAHARSDLHLILILSYFLCLLAIVVYCIRPVSMLFWSIPSENSATGDKTNKIVGFQKSFSKKVNTEYFAIRTNFVCHCVAELLLVLLGEKRLSFSTDYAFLLKFLVYG